MRSHVTFALFAVSAVLGAIAGCSERLDTGTGGSTTTTTTTTSGTTVTTGPFDVGCSADDGVCDKKDLGFGKGVCGCEDCQGTAYCHPDQCVADGACTLEDACPCEDCWSNFACSAPTMANCQDDGACDSFTEGCLCADCAADPRCEGFVQETPFGCTPGAGPDAECPGTAACVCLECQKVPYCNDKKHCVDNGVCELNEGCVCDDCASDPPCPGTGPGPGGAGGANMGGANMGGASMGGASMGGAGMGGDSAAGGGSGGT